MDFFLDVVSKYSSCVHPNDCGNLDIATKEEKYKELFHVANKKFLAINVVTADSEGLVTFNNFLQPIILYFLFTTNFRLSIIFYLNASLKQKFFLQKVRDRDCLL